jgi:serine/threonine protein phosphatase PrpC
MTAPEGRRAEDMPCPRCGQLVGVWDQFCEACGKELAPPAVSAGTPGYVARCAVCTADPDAPEPAVTAEGYCEGCGRKVPADRDHVPLDLGPLAGVSDRGLRHSRNEDAMAMAVAPGAKGPLALAVVCDGVSTSPRPDDGSLAAAQAAVRALLSEVRRGQAPEAASREAVRAAAEAIRGLAGDDGAPACTYASAIVSHDGVTVCWLGDSRVYWLAADSPPPVASDETTRPVSEVPVGASSQRLTKDDSLASELVATGLMSEEDAMASPQAHVITQWLGADFVEPKPHVRRFEPAGQGVVLVCSDGLWNYHPEAADLAALALPAGLTSPLDTAAALVKIANEAGGRDNITAVLIPFPPGSP